MATPVNTLPQFPTIKAPIALPSGQIHPAWQQLLVNLWNQQNQLAQTLSNLSGAEGQASQDGALLVPPQTQIAVG